MPITRIFGFVLSIVMVATLFSSLSSAQQTRRPLRWLGQGISDGYHQCNPGPNSDYYNPYTAHNSMLISQNPGMYGMPQRRVQEGPIQVGVPFSVYAAPAPVNSSRSFQSLPGVPIDNSFVPYNGKKPKEEKATKKMNDWVPADPDTKSTEENADDAAAYAPSLQGRVEWGSQVRSRSANTNMIQVDFSKASFQNRAIGEIVDERIEDGSNLINPFESNN